MKTKTFSLLVLMVIIISCKNDEDDVKTRDRLIGNWQHTLTVRGTEHKSASLGPVSYEFKADNSFVKNLGSFNWRDEGSWDYLEKSKTLKLTYKTYTTEVSETKSEEILVQQADDKTLVFKLEFNDTNSFGEFVEYEFVHFSRKE